MIRRDPNMTEKLACALLHWLEALGQPIPREHAQAMTAEQICSLFQWDHWPIRYIDGGTTHPDNLQPSFIAAHREKTSKIDVPQIRKADRIRKKRAGVQKRKAAIPARVNPWPKGRKLRSAGFPNARARL